MASNSHRLEFHIDIDDESLPLLETLVSASGLSRQVLKQAMDKGALWRTRGKHTQRLRRVKTPLRCGEVLHLYYDSGILEQRITPAILIAEETGYSIWYKPCGMACQGSKWGDHCTITRNVAKQTSRNAFLVHRLDRAATGLIIIAHEKNVAAGLSALFRERKIEKTYQAIVHGLHPALEAFQTIDHPIDNKSAVSHVQTLQHDAAACRSLLEVKIETGRKHQIRRHLAQSGYPIVGDRLYGRAGDSDNLQLCACQLAFTCPKTGAAKSYSLDPTLRPKL